MGCSASSDQTQTAIVPVIKEPGGGKRRKSYNTGGNMFPRSARGRKIEEGREEEIKQVRKFTDFVFNYLILIHM